MTPPDAADSDRAEVTRTTAELLAGVNNSDVARCASVYADDGLLMPPHRPSVQGREAIARYFGELFARSTFSFTLTSCHIDVAGEVAFERVTYTVTIRWVGDVAPIEDVGKGMHVYRRQPDGSWKLTCDIWNSDRPL